MQRACEMNRRLWQPVLALAMKKWKKICQTVTTETGEVVVA